MGRQNASDIGARPCPKCGSKEVWQLQSHYEATPENVKHFIQCTGCGFLPDWDMGPTKEAAIKEWNEKC